MQAPDIVLTLDPDQPAADRINLLYTQISDHLTEIAQLLIAVKARQDKHYTTWVAANLPFGLDTASRIVNAYLATERTPELKALGHTVAAKLVNAPEGMLDEVVSLLDRGIKPTGDQVTVMLNMHREAARAAQRWGVSSVQTLGMLDRLPSEVVEDIHRSGYVQIFDDRDAVSIADNPDKVMQALTKRRSVEQGVIVDGLNDLNLRVCNIEGYGYVIAGFTTQNQAENWVMKGKGK